MQNNFSKIYNQINKQINKQTDKSPNNANPYFKKTSISNSSSSNNTPTTQNTQQNYQWLVIESETLSQNINDNLDAYIFSTNALKTNSYTISSSDGNITQTSLGLNKIFYFSAILTRNTTNVSIPITIVNSNRINIYINGSSVYSGQGSSPTIELTQGQNFIEIFIQTNNNSSFSLIGKLGGFCDAWDIPSYSSSSSVPQNINVKVDPNAVGSNTNINILKWDINTDGVTNGYKIYRRGPYNYLLDPPQTGIATSVLSGNLAEGSKYYYYISANNSSGESIPCDGPIQAYTTNIDPSMYYTSLNPSPIVGTLNTTGWYYYGWSYIRNDGKETSITNIISGTPNGSTSLELNWSNSTNITGIYNQSWSGVKIYRSTNSMFSGVTALSVSPGITTTQYIDTGEAPIRDSTFAFWKLNGNGNEETGRFSNLTISSKSYFSDNEFAKGGLAWTSSGWNVSSAYINTPSSYTSGLGDFIANNSFTLSFDLKLKYEDLYQRKAANNYIRPVYFMNIDASQRMYCHIPTGIIGTGAQIIFAFQSGTTSSSIYSSVGAIQHDTEYNVTIISNRFNNNKSIYLNGDLIYNNSFGINFGITGVNRLAYLYCGGQGSPIGAGTLSGYLRNVRIESGVVPPTKTYPNYTSQVFSGVGVNLNWTAPATGTPDGYYIYRSDTQKWETNTLIAKTTNTNTYFWDSGYIATTGVPTLYKHFKDITHPTNRYDDIGVKYTQKYDYTLTSYNNLGNESNQSSVASVVAGDLIAPDTPSGIFVTPSDSNITLTWQDGVEPDLFGTYIYQSDSLGGSYTLVGDTRSNSWMKYIGYNSTAYFKLANYDYVGNTSALSTGVIGTCGSAPITNITGILSGLKNYPFDITYSKNPINTGFLTISISSPITPVGTPYIGVKQYGQSSYSSVLPVTGSGGFWSGIYTVVPGFDGTAQVIASGNANDGMILSSSIFTVDTVKPLNVYLNFKG